MSTPKQEVQELLGRLPDDCSLEDIQHQLYLMAKIRSDLDYEETLSRGDSDMQQEYDLRALNVRKVGSGRIRFGKLPHSDRDTSD